MLAQDRDGDVTASLFGVCVQIYGRRRGRAGGRGSVAGLTPQAVLSQLTDMGFEAGAAQSVLSQVGPSLELAVQQLLMLGGAVSGGGGAAAGAAGAASADAAGASAAADAQQPGSADGSRYQTPLPPEASEGDEVGADGEQAGESAGAAGASTGAEAAAEDEEDANEDEFEDEDEDEVSLSHPSGVFGVFAMFLGYQCLSAA